MAEILYESPAGLFESIVFDVTIRESHEVADETPRHPIEGRPDANDTVRKGQRVLTLEVGVTNKPTRSPISELTGEPIPDVVAGVQSHSLTEVARTAGFGTYAAKDYNLDRGVSAKSGAGVDLPLPAGLGSNLGGTEPQVTGATWSNRDVERNLLLLTVAPMDRVRAVFDQLDAVRGLPLVVLTSVRQYDSLVIRRIGAPIEHVGWCAFTLEFEQYNQAEAAELVPDPTEPRGEVLKTKGTQAGYELPATQRSAGREVTDAIGSWLQKSERSVPL